MFGAGVDRVSVKLKVIGVIRHLRESYTTNEKGLRYTPIDLEEDRIPGQASAIAEAWPGILSPVVRRRSVNQTKKAMTPKSHGLVSNDR